MVGKDEEIVADDGVMVSFESERVATDGKTGKPVADITRYTYRDGDARYVVTFGRQKTIVQSIFTDFDGAYHRFTGKVTIEQFQKKVRVQGFYDDDKCDMSYLSKASSPTRLTTTLIS